MKALVVLSGGQDSTTCAVIACATYGPDEVAAVTFQYGQRHSRELLAAKRIAALLGITNHEQVPIGPILKGTSPLTDPTQRLETYDNFESMDAIIGSRVEKTFVPMRNALFLTLAANRAACMGAQRIYTGVCQADNANYPDCRQSFIDKQAWAINEALGRTEKSPLRPDQQVFQDDALWIETPLMNMSKARSIQELWSYGLDKFALLAFSHTAYDGAYPPVGKDHASTLRAQGFLESGYPDPLVVRAYLEGRMELPATPNYRLMGDVPEAVGRLKQRLGMIDPSLMDEESGYQPALNEGSEA